MKRGKVVKIAKKFLAFSVATLTMVVGTFGGMTFSQKESEVEVEAATAVLSGEERNVIFANSRTDFRDESIYFVMVTRYYNGDESNDVQCWDGTQYNLNDPAWRGDFKGLIEKLDYIKALGFTAIWITPVVENCSGYDYHGYHAKDFSEVDERYESDDCTYQDLIDACHAKDMKIIQDVVLNHTGNFGEDNLIPMFDKVGDLSDPDCLQISANSELPDNYDSLTPAEQYQARLALMKNTDGVNHDVNNLYHHYGNFNWDDYTCQIAQIAGDCVDLNTENPLVYSYLVDAYTNYINMGVDGFRVDTVRHISRLTFNKVFNDAFKAAGEANGKDFFMFGEVCTRDNGNVWYRQSPSMSTPFYTWKESVDYPWSDTDWEVNYDSAIQCTLDNADASTIANQPTSDNAFLDGNDYHETDYSMFSGLNVIDFPMHWSFKTAENAFNVAKNGDKYYNDATWNVTYVDSHDYAPDGAPESERFNQDQDVWAENLSLMFTFRGIPCIYYGSETEFMKGATIDKGPNIALAESGRAYYGDNIEGTITAVDFGEYGNVSGAVGETLKHSLSQHIQRLNRLRQAIPALRKGQYSTEGVSGNLAFKRRYTDDTTDSFVCVSISGDATFTGIPNGTYVDAVTGDTKVVTNQTLSVSVSGKGNLKAYVLNTSKTSAPGRVITNGLYLTDGGAIEDIEPIEIEEVEVTGITLDKTTVSVLEAEAEKVTATVLPEDATYKTVKWTSSDTSVATVAGGRITGISPGTATITATTTNGKTATVKVTVSTNPNIVKPTGVSLSPTSLTITAGNTGKLTATVAPENTTDKSLTWTSSDTSVATVNKSGVVTAVAEGTATITATTFNGYKATATVTVEPKEVPELENGVYFEKPSGWGDTINVFMWSDSTGEKYMGAWPGTAIENLGDNLYGFSYESDVSDMMIIFNDGSNQTADLEFVNNGYYNVSGLVQVIDPSAKGKVNVEYVDESGNVLSSKILSGTVGSSYSTEAITIDGYTLKTTPSNATGTYTSDDITVTYVYSVNDEKEELKGTLTVDGSTATLTKTVGSSIKLDAVASGGSGSYTYKFSVLNVETGVWTALQNFATGSSYTFVLNYTGTKQFAVTVKDSEGTTVSSTRITVKVTNSETELKGTLKVNDSTEALTKTVGSKITLNAQATGGSGSYTYKFAVLNVDTGKWSALKDYSSTASYTYSLDYTGTKQFAVTVKDSNGKTVATNRITVNVVKETESLSAKLTVNGATGNIVAFVGDSINLSVATSGGSGSYTYKYVVYNVDTKAWFVLKDYNSSSSYTTKLSIAGTKQFVVSVKDSTGKIVSTERVTVSALN